jgi:hypothetical protein
MSWRVPALGGFGFALCLAVASCGGGGNTVSGGSSSGGGGTVSGANVASVTVSSGPSGVNAINTLYTSVEICVHGTTTCQTVDNVQVDTGSYGFRVLSEALGTSLTLPVSQATGGGALVECTEFVDGYSWGPVVTVDLKISGETASSVPIQVIGDSRYPTAPSNCSSGAPTQENTVATFGANGILGIGPFAQDCGAFCVSSIPTTIQYYSCSTATACQGTLVPLTAQVTNPVTFFTTDNNGSIIVLPAVASTGATDVTGSLIFGIDTETNNMSGTETVVPVSASTGYVTTVFLGNALANSFVDSGSNGNYFADSSLTACSGSSGSSISNFYCPAGPVTLTAAFVLANNSTASVNFVVASANSIGNTVTAYPGLAGTNPTSGSFDWGLPFFYGRRVANAIEGAATSVGTGPYIAY